MTAIQDFSVTPVSMIDSQGLQRAELRCRTAGAFHGSLVIRGDGIDLCMPVAVSSGENRLVLRLPPPETAADVTAVLSDGDVSASCSFHWEKPRRWTFYVMISSHTDIGLHNSQYHQRYWSERFLDEAAQLCRETEDRPENDRYRYTMEGRWFWENYPADRGAGAAETLLRDYIRPGKIGLCAGVAGNHVFAYGMEEMCRSTYGRSKIRRDWGVDGRTLSMIDNNGLPWSMVGPYAEAGYQNIIFAPNQWNPLPSTIWQCDKTVTGSTWNPEAGGGGSRVDVRYDSALPMVFYWQSADDRSRLLVWASTQYNYGGSVFGFTAASKCDEETLSRMEKCFAERLPKMESRYPYDLWLTASYCDDQRPSRDLTDLFAAWNAAWRYPQIRTLGSPDIPFDLIRERFGNSIPVLRGEIPAGWYQHPLAAPQLLADKLDADRALARAEIWSTAAASLVGRPYPAQAFSRAWEYLIWNNEHSYGTSGYQGRRVYETWMQHRDWIEKAAKTADQEAVGALTAIAAQIPGKADSCIVFNSTGHIRRERIIYQGRSAVVEAIPACGYLQVRSLRELQWTRREYSEPPVVENCYYRVEFSSDGSMSSVFDKELGRELIQQEGYGANCFLFTDDNHRTFSKPGHARFTVETADHMIRVTAVMDEQRSGASVTQIVTLDETYCRIDVEDRIEHARALINRDRYHRYVYYAFPFSVERPRRICRQNGCEAEYAVDLTGHGTDTYMHAHEWCCVENGDYGVALLQRDSLLVEFDHIHPDKTDCGSAGEGSAVYSYVANDWLQMHEIGGSHVNLRLRYAITSWRGDHVSANLSETAECWMNPVTVLPSCSAMEEQKLPAEALSFAQVSEDQRLVDLKRAEDGRGIVARLYGPRKDAWILIRGCAGVRIAVDEEDGPFPEDGFGFTTFRNGTEELPRREDARDLTDEDCPAQIGAVWTGLITDPRAAPGEDDGMLYLLWGANMERNLSHYELYRSKDRDFTPSEDTRIARVDPEPYRCARYVDTGLDSHTEYWYRVRAVNTSGRTGAFSEPFSGITREPIAD